MGVLLVHSGPTFFRKGIADQFVRFILGEETRLFCNFFEANDLDGGAFSWAQGTKVQSSTHLYC